MRSTLISEKHPPHPVSQRGHRADDWGPIFSYYPGLDVFIADPPRGPQPGLLGWENRHLGSGLRMTCIQITVATPTVHM